MILSENVYWTPILLVKVASVLDFIQETANATEEAGGSGNSTGAALIAKMAEEIGEVFIASSPPQGRPFSLSGSKRALRRLLRRLVAQAWWYGRNGWDIAYY